MILDTHRVPVRGSVHLSNIFGLPLLVCSMVTTTREPGALTKSMAPPIPFINLPCSHIHNALLQHSFNHHLVRRTTAPHFIIDYCQEQWWWRSTHYLLDHRPRQGGSYHLFLLFSLIFSLHHQLYHTASAFLLSGAYLSDAHRLADRRKIAKTLSVPPSSPPLKCHNVLDRQPLLWNGAVFVTD